PDRSGQVPARPGLCGAADQGSRRDPDCGASLAAGRALRPEAPLPGREGPVGGIQPGRCALPGRPTHNASAVMEAMPSGAERSPQSHPTGLPALVLLLRLQDIAVDDRQLAHQYGQTIGVTQMLRCAKDLKLKCRAVESSWERLARTTFPAIAERKDGSFFILCKVADETVLILDPMVGRPQSVGRAGFEAEWNGRLVLMTRRAGLGELARRFDIGWFLQAMHKYRGLLSEVLVASFFLQLFALVSPLFFQGVIDKVLVHRGLSTLDAIVFGLIVVSLFESVLTAIRTYVFSHTTNRIDVELGARLFKHLVALPIAYFEARRTGHSVARVRE